MNYKIRSALYGFVIPYLFLTISGKAGLYLKQIQVGYTFIIHRFPFSLWMPSISLP